MSKDFESLRAVLKARKVAHQSRLEAEALQQAEARRLASERRKAEEEIAKKDPETIALRNIETIKTEVSDLLTRINTAVFKSEGQIEDWELNKERRIISLGDSGTEWAPPTDTSYETILYGESTTLHLPADIPGYLKFSLEFENPRFKGPPQKWSMQVLIALGTAQSAHDCFWDKVKSPGDNNPTWEPSIVMGNIQLALNETLPRAIDSGKRGGPI